VDLSQDLVLGQWKDLPRLLLNLIMDKLMFAEVIHHPTFPLELEISTQPQQPGYMPKINPKVPRHKNKPTHPGVGDRITSNPGPQPGKIKWVHLREL
jgi:hypothetical protein